MTAAGSTYGEQLQAAIAEKEREASSRTVGILEELEAISAESPAVTAAHWVLRLLLIVIDCLPVLTKWISGSTAYDRVVRREIESSLARHAKDLERREKSESMKLDALAEEQTRGSRASLSEARQRRDEEVTRLHALYRS